MTFITYYNFFFQLHRPNILTTFMTSNMETKLQETLLFLEISHISRNFIQFITYMKINSIYMQQTIYN